MINFDLFDARVQYRDFLLAMHLWASLRGDSVVADECAWRCNGVHGAMGRRVGA
jgi:hypothetical protein